MAEPQEFDPFVSAEEIELTSEELAILEERDTGEETQFVSAREARERFREWLSNSSTKRAR